VLSIFVESWICYRDTVFDTPANEVSEHEQPIGELPRFVRDYDHAHSISLACAEGYGGKQVQVRSNCKPGFLG
jgi:hypothetical protein